MSVLNIPRNYSSNTTPTEQQMADIQEAVETFFNTTGVGENNIALGSLTSAVIEASSITSSKVAVNSIPGNKKGLANYVTNTCGVAADSVQVTITTTGRPVMIIVTAASASEAFFDNSGGTGGAVIRRNGPPNRWGKSGENMLLRTARGSPPNTANVIPASAWGLEIDTDIIGSPGTYTYNLTDVGSFTLNNVRLTVVEI